jgi:hypothetical protein
LKRLPLVFVLVLVAGACAGCEAILGFGDTRLSASDGGRYDAAEAIDHETVDDAPPHTDAPEAPRQGDTGAAEERGADAGDADGVHDATDAPNDDADDASSDDADDADGGADDATDAPNDDADDASSDDADATDAPNDAPDAGWTPLEVPGLAVWLDAAVGATLVEGRVVRWQDRSSHGNSAGQADRLRQPLLTPAGIGSYPGIVFEGNGELLTIDDKPSMRFGTDDFVVLVVMRHKTSTTSTLCLKDLPYGLIFVKQETDFPFTGFCLVGNSTDSLPSVPLLRVQVDYPTNVEAFPASGMPGFNDDVPRLVGMYRQGDTLSLRLNGQTAGSVAIPAGDSGRLNIDAVGRPAVIGSNGDVVAQCLDGVISEIVAASGVTEDEVTSLESYLLAKHAAALAAGMH